MKIEKRIVPLIKKVALLFEVTEDFDTFTAGAVHTELGTVYVFSDSTFTVYETVVDGKVINWNEPKGRKQYASIAKKAEQLLTEHFKELS